MNPLYGEVKVFDTIALKSCFGTYLSTSTAPSSSSNLTTHSPSLSTDSVTVSTSTIGDNQLFHLSKSSLPFIGEWARTRVFDLNTGVLSGTERESNGSGSGSSVHDAAILNKYPIEVQEQLLVEDLLYTLIGKLSLFLCLSV